jgi:hypothetical protein
MNSTEMISRLPLFKIKDINGNGWKTVSEKDFLLRLEDTFEMITPALTEMFRGREISTRDCIYKIQYVRY